jgi:hypothetical protein
VRAAPALPRRTSAFRSLLVGSILAAIVSACSVSVVTHLWNVPMHVPFQYEHSLGDDEQDSTLDMMLIKNIHETGWFNTNPHLNAPFAQRWAEWPMGGDLLAYTLKKGIVEVTGDVPLTFNLFWLLTFPLTALAAFPVLRSLRCSWASSLVGAVLFSLTPYHFRNGAGHENLAFYVGVPVIVLLCVKILGPDSALPSVRALRERASWWRMRWWLAGAVLVGVTGIYYLAFLLSLLGICATVSALARRRPGRLVIAALFGSVGLVASFLANLPTLLFRWQHPANLLGVPDRQLGVAEAYPLRIVELLSPVSSHRFPPFATIASLLQEPGREGFGTVQLGVVGVIGFVCAVTVVLVRAVGSSDRRGWSLEARLGLVIVAALLLATKGGLNRALELVGLSGVRAWSRIGIVIAFASIVVAARLLDRARVALILRSRRRSGAPPRRKRRAWGAVLALIVVVGVLDQSSPPLTPGSSARIRLWREDDAFVAAMERQLPKNAMVFQLPVADFPEHGAVERMAAHDLVKEGYLHSKTLRWSAGGMRGRDGEWQWPASALPLPDLVRGVRAMGFTALMLDRFGFVHVGTDQLNQLLALLGPPIATRGDRLYTWDLRPATAKLLGAFTVEQRQALAQQMLDAPRLYLTADIDSIASRGDRRIICSSGMLTLVNPAHTQVRRQLELTLTRRDSHVQRGHLTINGRDVPISAGFAGNVISVDLAPGLTRVKISINHFGARCGAVPRNNLPGVTARFRPVPLTAASG